MTRTAKLKLLIVDDHAPMRQTLRALLSPMTGDIYEASDGSEGVRIFAEQQPDWVIMDIQMKPVGGLAATREIRRRFPAARIVILTQYDDAELRAEAARAGACAYLLKDELQSLRQRLMSEIGAGDVALDDDSCAQPNESNSNSTINQNSKTQKGMP